MKGKIDKAKKEPKYKPDDMIRVHKVRKEIVEMPYKDLERYKETEIAKSNSLKRGEFYWWFERILK